MAKKSTFANMVIVLSLVCLVCSALLGAVYAVTAEPIAAANLAKTNNAIGAVVPAFDNIPSQDAQEVELDGTSYKVYPAKSASTTVGYAIESTVVGFGGPLTVMVGFTPDGAIYNTSVVSHAETPGIGTKAAEKKPGNFREQFAGKNPASFKLAVKKEGGDIDAITASTISSKAFIDAVGKAYAVFCKINGVASDAVSGASQKSEE